MATSITDEFNRVRTMLSRLTVSFPIMIMDAARIEAIQQAANQDTTLASLRRELLAKLRAITRPEDHGQMAQAYEAYSEASFYLEMKARNVTLERTPGTGEHGEKRPDFRHSHATGSIYFEVKALEIADPLSRHKEIAYEALEIAADLDMRARKPGIHFGKPHQISGHIANADTVERIDDTIEKISNNVKPGQIHYGPTVLVVDMGRFGGIRQGPSGLLPIFFHDGPPAESCVSGELWQIALGLPGEQVLSLPEFDGQSNLAGHQNRQGLLHDFPGLFAVTFMLPRWSKNPELLTIWNIASDQTLLQNPCTLPEREVGELLARCSDGLNDQCNELGWKYRVSPLR
jgi:hypothetical protein